MYEKIITKNDDEWKALRTNGIGSSEIGIIIGASNYSTPRQLWLEKTAQRNGTWVEPERTRKNNLALKSGHALESLVAEEWEEETGNHVLRNTAGNWIAKSDRLEWMQASPDRLYYINNKRKNLGILECKTSKFPIDPDNIPKSWFAQLQYQLGVMELKRGCLAWYVKSSEDFGWIEFEFDSEFFEWMIAKADDFWNRCIIGGEEPEAATSEEFNAVHPKSEEGLIVEASASSYLKLQKMSSLSVQIDALTKEKEMIALELKKEFGDAEKMMYGGSVVATFKTNKDSQSFDKARFSKEYPDIYNKYIVTKSGSRPFINKVQ